MNTMQCLLIFWGVLFFIMILMLFSSITYIEQNEYGVVTNTYTEQFEDDILIQGTYLYLPGYKITRFKRTIQNIELGDFECITKDEIKISIHVSTQFQFKKKALIPIVLMQFDNQNRYLDFLNSLMRSIVLNSCLEFNTIQYYEQRTTVDKEINDNLVNFINNGNYGSTVEFFQLTDITYPDDYISILHEKQNIKQELITQQNNRNTEVVKANTDRMEFQKNANINIIDAMAYQNITLYNAYENENIIKNKWEYYADIFELVMNDFNFNSTQSINYIKYEIIGNSKIYSSI
jgi:regulator of protease activity HflC (stomatin/prohibitin superfamily)